MLRRVARVLRGLLLVLGLMLLVALPTSWLVSVSLDYERPGTVFADIRRGVLVIGFHRQHPATTRVPPRPALHLQGSSPDQYGGRQPLLPEVVHGGSYLGVPGASGWSPTWEWYSVHLPLWLLAFLCLAWPVTSFIIARRRHKRGFPIEPKGAGDSVNTSAS